jgi:signal transduction histidine kinase
MTASADSPEAADLESASPDRLRRLVDIGIALSSELSLESVLRRLVETAVELTGARYGALGVVDASGTGLEQFVTVGVDAETREAIGDPPRGRGILGVLIQERRPLRLRDLSQDPRSVGFPPGHPAMSSFLGVPIMLRGTAYGNLYLTEKVEEAEFSDQDEEIVLLLAAQAAVAIENARLYEASRHWARQLESLGEVSEALLAAESDVAQLLDLAAERLRELIDARAVLIGRPIPGGTAIAFEAASGDHASDLRGLRLDVLRSKAGRTFVRQRPERIDSVIDDPEVDQTAPRLVDATSALYVPLIAHGRSVGVVAAFDRRGPDTRFTDADMRIAQAFANRAAVAVELSERVGREAVKSLLEGQEIERKRLARELHDETGQALASILLGLKSLERQVGPEAVSPIRELVGAALDDVRRLTVELRPPALDDFGLASALERLASLVTERSGIDIQVSIRPSVAIPPDQETALYRIVQEALTNVVKHAEATSVSVIVTSSGDAVRAVIEDDGIGFDPKTVREGALGLVGIRERALLLGGRFELESSPGAGTTILVELPAQPVVP